MKYSKSNSVSDAQFGFGPGVGIIVALIALQRIIDKHLSNK